MKTSLGGLGYMTLLASPSLAAMAAWKSPESPGCGKLHDSGYHDADATQTIRSGNYDRTYGIYVPKSYNKSPNVPRKVIFDYHGNNGTPKQQKDNSQYFNYTDGEQYLVVYPAGYDQSWQSAPYAEPGVDDLKFTSDLLDHIRKNYCIDDNHVYASGKSNGGGFVDYLACHDAGNEFAAFGMAAAALYSDNSQDACKTRRAIIESHGENDTTIWYTGGQKDTSNNKGTLPDIRNWIGWWAVRDGCSRSDKPKIEPGKGYERITYSCGGLKDVVVHYAVKNLGHCWPDSVGDNSDGSRSYCYDHSLDYTRVVLDFFSRWNLKNAPHK